MIPPNRYWLISLSIKVLIILMKLQCKINADSMHGTTVVYNITIYLAISWIAQTLGVMFKRGLIGMKCSWGIEHNMVLQRMHPMYCNSDIFIKMNTTPKCSKDLLHLKIRKCIWCYKSIGPDLLKRSESFKFGFLF